MARELNALDRIRKRVLCDWLDMHVGHPEARGGMVYFYCTRCHEYTNPRDLPPGRYGLEELK